MIVNLCMGYDDRTWTAIKAVDEDGNRTHPVNRGLGSLRTPGLFRITTGPSPRSYELWALYIEAETEQDVRDYRNDILAEFPGQVRTIGAWLWDGRQLGTEWEVVDGERTGDTTGTPTFPLHASILDHMPKHFNPATELFDIDPTDLSTGNTNFGQAIRRL